MVEKVGGKNKIVAHMSPSSYPIKPQQQIMKKVNQECGIQKGISQDELTDKMTSCVSPKMKKYNQIYRETKDLDGILNDEYSSELSDEDAQ
ncbi:MAG: hypothetical protein ACOCQD_00275 [archaeon]